MRPVESSTGAVVGRADATVGRVGATGISSINSIVRGGALPKAGTPRESTGLLGQLRELLESLPSALPQDRARIRAEVLRLADLTEGVRRLARTRLRRLTTKTAAKDRIIAYLKLFPGTVIEGRELQVVAGIQEFARRVRELRVEDGYNISTGYWRKDLKPDQYVLESPEPDEEAADKWRTANHIRRHGGGARDRILALLRAYVHRPVKGELVAYVAGIREAARRVRELRRELGWRIVTRQTGRPDLPPGVYVLESESQLPPHDRVIPDDVYERVLERDGYRCRRCGWSVERRHPAGRRQFLEVHHIEHHGRGGPNNPENLITLCNVHHDDLHRLDLAGREFFGWLRRGSSEA